MATQTACVETELVEVLQTPNDNKRAAEPEQSLDSHAAPARTTPKYDRATTLKLMSAGFSFFVAGVNDGSIGALMPYFMRQYGISTTVVSTV